MRGILIILLLLAVNLCYGQGKYTLRKTYQYEGNDSTNAKWVLTEKYNTNNKVVFARFNKYKGYADDSNDDFERNGKAYYTYNDTNIINILTAYKKRIIDSSGVITLNTYKGGDTEIVHYEYKYDSTGRVIEMKEKEYSYKMTPPQSCMGFNEITPLNVQMYREGLYHHHDTLDYYKVRYVYNDNGLVFEDEFPNTIGQIRTVYLYEYLGKSSLKAVVNTNEQNPVTRIYFYNGDTTKICSYNKFSLFSTSAITNNTLSIPCYCDMIVYDKSKRKRIELLNNYIGVIIKEYFYDEYGRKIKDISTLTDSKLTHLYTYE